MRLLRFLQRRLRDGEPKSLLHKWVRSGQVRVNGGRSTAFARLAANDLVRLPPFARARETGQSSRPDTEGGGASPAAPGALLGPGVRVICICDDVLILDKASGVSCHPGGGSRRKTGAGRSGSTSENLSVAEILAGAFASSPYIPAPAHRLDRRSSGLLLAGLSRAAAARLQIQFKNGEICKYYLAWSAGFVPWEGPLLLEDRLVKRVFGGREIIKAIDASTGPYGGLNAPGAVRRQGFTGKSPRSVSSVECSGAGLEGQKALCAALVLRRQESGSLPVPASLLLLRLLSGRKHQLRAQLAARGFPLIGDGLRGGPDFPILLLHAHSLRIPARGAQADPSEGRLAVSGDKPAQEAGYEFCTPAPWPLDLVLDEREMAGAKKILDAHIAAGGL
ncbi:MAG: hypothetical protein LBS65_07955 [Desulfovibrio sp.]|nr:hypothetical protein [Desulfovibrio sp.]